CRPDQIASGRDGHELEFPRRRECEWRDQFDGCRTGQIRRRSRAALTADPPGGGRSSNFRGLRVELVAQPATPIAVLLAKAATSLGAARYATRSLKDEISFLADFQTSTNCLTRGCRTKYTRGH